MSAPELLIHFFGINANKLSKEERLIVEAELFICLCQELKEVFREKYKEYFFLMKFTKEKENEMLEANFISLVIQDILASEEYNLTGVAQYTDTPEDVVHEVVSGRNTRPSATLLKRAIELHRSVRRELYQAIKRKIIAECMPITM